MVTSHGATYGPLTGGGALSQITNCCDILLSQICFICRFAMEFGQAFSVVVEQKVFGFRLEQTKLLWAVLSISSKLNLCQKGTQQVSSRGKQESLWIQEAKNTSCIRESALGKLRGEGS